MRDVTVIFAAFFLATTSCADWKEFLQPKECGLTVTDRIVGGSEAGLQQFPWVVFLVYGELEAVARCGGSLLNSRFVLTANHCVYHNGIKVSSVRLGEHDWRTNPDQVYVYGGMYTAPPYEEVNIKNTSHFGENDSDVALLLLERDVIYTPFIKPICLPTPRMDSLELKGKMATVAGWGKTYHISNPSYTKQWVTLPIRSSNESFVLAGGEPGKDSCNSDSGTPLSIAYDPGEYGTDIRYYQVGVTKKGPAVCGTENETGSYVNMIHLRTAVIDKMMEMRDYRKMGKQQDYYKFYSDRMTSKQARQECRNDKSELMVINSEDENKIIQELLREAIKAKKSSSLIHIGNRKDPDTHGSVSGEAKYIHWAKISQQGEKSNCLGASRDALVRYLDCETKKSFICEAASL